MKNVNLILLPEIQGKSKAPWNENDFKTAIKKFRQNAPSAPIPRLYDAYRWLKEHINTEDEALNRQFTNFIEHFLIILEERGAVNSEIYTEVLRDSAEYKYLRGLFRREDSINEKLLSDKPAPIVTDTPAVKKAILKDILKKKDGSLLEIDIKSWHKLIEEHLKGYKDEISFVKNCSHMVNAVKKITEKESYHIEIIIVYAFDTLLRYKQLNIKTKDFAMQLLNQMTDRGEMWSTLHKEYLEIIKK